jgi:ubiquinone/menaquinone biosynthesis C-methylase UbiE
MSPAPWQTPSWKGLQKVWDRLSTDVASQWEKKAQELEADPTEAFLYLRRARCPQTGVGLLIDVACGPAVLEPHWSKRVGEIVALDFSTEQLVKAKRRIRGSGLPNVELVQADARQLPIRPRIADWVLSLGLLRHMPPKGGWKALAEMCRISKGSLYVNDIPNLFHVETLLYKTARLFFGPSMGGVYFYNPYRLRRFLKEIGLEEIGFVGYSQRWFPKNIPVIGVLFTWSSRNLFAEGTTPSNHIPVTYSTIEITGRLSTPKPEQLLEAYLKQRQVKEQASS